MKISFYQQAVTETEKKYTEKASFPQNTSKDIRTVSCQAAFGEGAARLWGSSMTGTEKGKSLIELQQEAENTNVAVQQDYMTLMSNTLSEEDYAQLEKEGFHFASMEPEQAVTIVDKIKAELVRSGKNIAGYTDDLDMDTLTAAVGSQVLAEALVKSFQEADLPLTEENCNQVLQAWNLAAQLKPVEEGTARYFVDNELSAEIWNLYLAQNSGAGRGTNSAPGFFAEDIKGYYTQSASQEQIDLTEQIDKVIEQSGREVTQENRKQAEWLLSKGLALTPENLDRLDSLGELQLPPSEEDFAAAAAAAVTEGKNPVHADLTPKENTDKQTNIYEKASELADYYQSDAVLEENADNLTARRQLEEIRLRMTAEVNVKLLKSGFSIDTAPMEELVEALKQAEAEVAKQYFPEDTQAVEKYRSFCRTNEIVQEIPTLPAQALGMFAKGQTEATLEEFHSHGKAVQETYEKAHDSYEALMTTPRSDMGDSIKKAFGNLDDILQDMGQEASEENRRAARILAYNRMEMTTENLNAVKEADNRLQWIVQKMTPAAVLKMIRDDVNPLEKNLGELEEYFEELPEEYQSASESYSRFLYGLEKKQEITPQERESYIGIYRLLHQIEKGDGAAVGALVNTQAQLQFSNLLSAVRSSKAKGMDIKVTESFGTVSELLDSGKSISDQIQKAFVKEVQHALTEASYSETAEAAYRGEALEELRKTVQASQDSVLLLQRGEVPATADNLLAAQALTSGIENLFEKTEKKEKEEQDTESLALWQKLEQKETFQSAYEELLEEAVSDTQEATFSEASTSLDVRDLQLTHKQLTVLSALSRQEEYIVPMYIGENLARVHLVFEKGESQKGTVQIRIQEEEESLEAELRLENGTVHGMFTAKTQKEVMKLQQIADTFREEAKESWTIGELSVVEAGGFGSRTEERIPVEKIENAELYRLARVFLGAVRQEGNED